MSGRYLTDLADVLAAAELDVVELDGWQSRARSSGGYPDGGPWCVMWHHTASNGDGASDAHYETFVSENAPVCNLNVGRDGIVYVCAAGATNTNGKGGPTTLPDGRTVAADSMNTRAIGVEISNDGIGMPYPAVQLDAAFTVSLACCAAYDLPADNVVQHVDWAPGRKIDPATAAAVPAGYRWQPRSINSSGSWALADLRAECVARAAPTPPEPTPEEELMIAGLLTRTNDGVPWVLDPALAWRYALNEAAVAELLRVGGDACYPTVTLDAALIDAIPSIDAPYPFPWTGPG